MITGDHAATASAIASELGLKNPNEVTTGPELDDLDDAALRRTLAESNVFARSRRTRFSARTTPNMPRAKARSSAWKGRSRAVSHQVENDAQPDAEDQEHEQLAQAVNLSARSSPHSGIEDWRTVAADPALASMAR
jgi:hypothetical protein